MPVDTVHGFFEDCLILADDFRQYYLGAFVRTSIADPRASPGSPRRSTATAATFGGPVVAGDNPLDEAGVFQPTSDVLPPDEFPQFASQGAAEYAGRRRQPVRAGRGQRATRAPCTPTTRTCA